MRRILYGMFVSLDGYISGPNGELDWAIVDEELHRFVNDRAQTIDTQLYGRRMYETMNFWLTADTDPNLRDYEREFASLWQRAERIVFSKTLRDVQGNARLARDIDPQEIEALKRQPGQDIEVGGAHVAAALMRHGLIDEYQVYVHPVILGGGTPMFMAANARTSLRLVETRTFSSGVVLLRYEPTKES